MSLRLKVKKQILSIGFMKFEVVNWENTFNDSHLLFEKIFLDGYIPDLIIAIARGGWIPGRLMADFFRTKETANIKVVAYQQIGEEDVKAKITQNISSEVEGKKLLIVDDIADSGESIDVVCNNLENKNPSEIRTAVIHYKERSKIVPDYYLYITDSWVIYPWEFYETIQELCTKMIEEGMEEFEIRKNLLEVGIPVSMIDSYFAHYKDQ